MLLTELKAPAQTKRELEKLREEGRAKGWWTVYTLPDWLRPLVSFETDASSITSFEPVIVPGLLQTEDYSRSIHSSALPKTSPPEELERRVELRRERRKRLTCKKPLELHVVIAEAALRLEVGGPELMAEQLWHLVRLASAPNIRVQVLPYKVGAHAGVLSNLAVLHFANPKLDPPLGYMDGPLGGNLVDDAGEVEVLSTMFQQVHELALPETESVDFLASVRDEYRADEPKKTRRMSKAGP